MPEPLIRKTIPGHPGMAVTVERVQKFWCVEALVDGHAVARTISDDLEEAAEIWGRSVVLLSLGAPIEDVPLGPAGGLRVRPQAEIVDVACMGASPSARAYFANGLPYGQDDDPDGGVFI